MSGRPSSEGVALLRAEVVRRRELSNTIASTKRELQGLQAALTADSEELARVEQSIIVRLEQMDTYSSGNAGHAGRLLWMLGELIVTENPNDQP